MRKVAGAKVGKLLGIVWHQKWDVKDRDHRIEAGDKSYRRHGAFERAELNALAQLPRVAQLAGRKQIELDFTFGALFHQLGDFDQSVVTRLLGRFKMSDF